MAKILFLGNLGVVEIGPHRTDRTAALRRPQDSRTDEGHRPGHPLVQGGCPRRRRGTGAEGVTAHRRNRHRRKNVPPVVSYAAHEDASRPVARERSGIYPSIDQRRRRPMDSGRKRYARFLPVFHSAPTPAIRSSTANELAAGTPHRKFRRFEKIVYLCVKHQMIR